MEDLIKNGKAPLLTAINPYALADAVSEKKISWGTDPVKQQTILANELGITVDELFSADNPIVHPYAFKQTEPTAQGMQQRKVQAPVDARKQVKEFLDKKLVNTPQNLIRTAAASKKKTLAIKKRDRILKTLFATESQPDYKADSTPVNCEWKDNGVYYYRAPEGDDPIQGAIGDCYLIASLASIAWAAPFAIQNRASLYLCDSLGDVAGNVCHQFVFYRNGKIKTIIEVSDRIPINKNTGRPIYGISYDELETWLPIYEKAYAKFISGHTGDKPNYKPINGGNTFRTLAEMTGGEVSYIYNRSKTPKEILKFIQSNCGKASGEYWAKDGYSHRVKNPMTAEIWANDEAKNYGLYASHAYSILGFDYENGQYYVVLRNPHGAGPATKDVKQGKWNVISNHAGYGSIIPLNVSDVYHKKRWSGIFALKLETFAKIFACTVCCKV